MHRTSTVARRLLTPALALALLGALAAPAAAAPKTTVSISKAKVGKTLTVTGKLVTGTDALAPVQVAEDPAGDDLDAAVPNGLDITAGSIQADLANRTLTFRVDLADAMPGVTIMPGFVLNWQFTVDGTDTGRFIQFSSVGVIPPTAPQYIYLCRSTEAEFACDHELQGAFDEGGVTAVVPFSLLGVEPGSVIGQGAAIGDAEAITTTAGIGAGGFLNNNGGDTAEAVDYAIPGGVLIGIAKAGTKAAKVRATTLATVKKTSFSAVLPKPKKGKWIVVARTCYGSVCKTAARTITV